MRDAAVSILALVDGILVLISMMAAAWIRMEWNGWPAWLPTDPEIRWTSYSGYFVSGMLLFWVLASACYLYRRNALLLLRRSPMRILKIVFYWMMTYLLLSVALKFEPDISRIYVFLSFGFMVILLNGWRGLFIQLLKRPGLAWAFRRRMLVLGWGPDVKRLVEIVEKDPHHPYEVTGVVRDREGGHDAAEHPGIPILGSMDSLEETLQKEDVEILMLADGKTGFQDVGELVHLAGKYHLDFKMVSSFFPLFSTGLKVQTVSGVPVLGIEELSVTEWPTRLVKRLFDLIGASLGLLAGFPLIVIFGLLVRWESPGPVFYTQKRVGRDGKLFPMLKIRSMRVDADAAGAGWSVPDDPRCLRVGAFMRKWNIDEIPQFWNVFCGQMSLVGPRPEQPEFVENFSGDIFLYDHRHRIKPGITGWAQIHGWRGDTDIKERLRCDLYYVENWSIWLDIYICLVTLIRNRNAY